MNFNPLEDCKRHTEQFFAEKDKKMWEDGINKLLKIWQSSETKIINLLFDKIHIQN